MRTETVKIAETVDEALALVQAGEVFVIPHDTANRSPTLMAVRAVHSKDRGFTWSPIGMFVGPPMTR